jgi:AraC family transcriptional activator of tynA and feaB
MPGTSPLNFEAWRALLRTICGRYNPEGVEPKAFIGWVRPLNVCGLAAVDIGWNAHRVERTHRDIRLDGAEHYYAVFQVSGKSAMTQNEQAVQLAAGDVVLVDAARPVTYFRNDTSAQWLSVRLPRRSLVSHLGFEPQGGSWRLGGTLAGRLLFGPIHGAETDNGPPLGSAHSYMQLAVYDLVGALFAPSDPRPISRPASKLFARICGVIKHGFSDPDFGPVEVARRSGNLVTLPSKALYGARLLLQRVHRFASFGPRRTSSEPARAAGYRPASQRDRLCLRLS